MYFYKKIIIKLTNEEKELLKNAREFFSNLADEMESGDTINGYDASDMISVCYRIDSILNKTS